MKSKPIFATCPVLFITFGALFLTSQARAADQTWTGTAGGGWQNTGNWSGAAIPGSISAGNTDLAVFNVATNPTVNLNIGSPNSYYLGAIEFDDTTNRIIQNNAAGGTVLTLNGRTLNSVANTILYNHNSALLTIQNGSNSLGLGLGNATDNIVQITGAGGITISSVISGANRLTLQGGGAGVLTLSSGANSYTGATVIKAGVLSVSTLANGGANSDIGASPSLPASNLSLNGGTLRYTGAAVTTDRSFQIGSSGAGTIDASGSGLLWFNSTNAIGLGGSVSHALTLTGTGTGQIDLFLGDNVGASSVTKDGVGTWTLGGGANSYTGATVIKAGVLSVSTLANGGANSDIGASPSLPASNLSLNGGTLRYTGAAVTTDRSFQIGSSGAGTIDASGSGLLWFNSTNAIGLGGSVSHALTLTGTGTGQIDLFLGDNVGASSVTKDGVGTWTLGGGANSYTGATVIKAGVLSVSTLANGGANSDIGASPSLPASNLNLNGGTLRYTGAAVTTDRSFQIGSSGAGTIDASGSGLLWFNSTNAIGLGGSVSHALTLTGTGTGQIDLFLGDNVGASSVTKDGVGTWTLGGANTYTGGTTVSAGTLLANNTTGSGTGSGAVTVNGGVFGGTGAVSSAVNVNGGTLSPGASIESLATGALTFNNGSTFLYELNSSVLNGDLQVVNGNLNLNGTVTLDLIESLAGSLSPGSKLALINYSGSWNNNLFTYLGNPLANNATFGLGANQWQIRYNDTSGAGNFASDYVAGSFVTLTVVPEPSGLLLLLLGALGLSAVLRQRKK